MQQRMPLRRAREAGALTGAPVLVSGQGWLGWTMFGIATAMWLVLIMVVVLVWWHDGAPDPAVAVPMLGGGVLIWLIASLFFSLRVAVYEDGIVVRNWWWLGEARWEEVTELASARGYTEPFVVPVFLRRRGRQLPLPLFPPFAAQRELVPYVFERVYEANPDVIVDEAIFRRFELGVQRA